MGGKRWAENLLPAFSGYQNFTTSPGPRSLFRDGNLGLSVTLPQEVFENRHDSSCSELSQLDLCGGRSCLCKRSDAVHQWIPWRLCVLASLRLIGLAWTSALFGFNAKARGRKGAKEVMIPIAGGGRRFVHHSLWLRLCRSGSIGGFDPSKKEGESPTSEPRARL